MTALERKLKDTLQRLALSPDDAVVIGVSGGADSMALLDAMDRLRKAGFWRGEVHSAHVNHQLRGAESEEDERFVENWVKDWSQTLQQPTVTTHVDVAKRARESGQNLEAAARQVRYDFFRWFAGGHKIPLVFTAHTYDDQVETLVMRWLRGAGADGMRGIHEVSDLCEGVRLIRPLLEVTRAEVLEHCAHYGVAFRTDSSNLSDDYTRNRVRRHLLPLLREFNPQFGEALLRNAAVWQSDAACLDEQAAALWLRAQAGAELLVTELATAHLALRMRILRQWVSQQRGDLRRISAGHWQSLDHLLVSGQSGRTLALPYGWRVSREFDRLRLWQIGQVPVRPMASRLEFAKPQLFGQYELMLYPPMTLDEVEQLRRAHPTTLSAILPAALAADSLQLRTRQAGDTYVPVGRTSAVKLKTLMIRHKIPLHQRDCHPLLVTGDDQIVWSPGLPLALAYSTRTTQTSCILVIAREQCNLPALAAVMPDRSESEMR